MKLFKCCAVFVMSIPVTVGVNQAVAGTTCLYSKNGQHSGGFAENEIDAGTEAYSRCLRRGGGGSCDNYFALECRGRDTVFPGWACVYYKNAGTKKGAYFGGIRSTQGLAKAVAFKKCKSSKSERVCASEFHLRCDGRG